MKKGVINFITVQIKYLSGLKSSKSYIDLHFCYVKRSKKVVEFKILI